MENLLREYENYLIREKGLSKQSVDSYLSDVRSFFDFFDLETESEIFKVSKAMIMAYNSETEKLGKSRSTVMRSLSSIRSFYSYLDKKRLINSNPSDNIKISREKKNYIEQLNEKEINKFLNQPKDSTYFGMRDRVMFEILYKSGIEVNELIMLNAGDFNGELNYLKCGLKGKSRIVAIEDSLKTSIEKYLEFYKEKAELRDDAPLFLNYSGGRISRQGFWKLMKKHCKDAGLNADVTAYTLKQSSFADRRR